MTYIIFTYIDEIESLGGNACFMSTPSIYFTLNPELRKTCALFDVGATRFPL